MNARLRQARDRTAEALYARIDVAALVLADLVNAAALYWEGIDADDFVLQHVGEVIVFGATNRLTWHPSRGFKPVGDAIQLTFIVPHGVSIEHLHTPHAYLEVTPPRAWPRGLTASLGSLLRGHR